MIYYWHTKLLSIRLELFVSSKLQVVLRMSSNFSRDKQLVVRCQHRFHTLKGTGQQPEQSNYLAEGQVRRKCLAH